MNTIVGVFALLVLLVILCAWFRDFGYKTGYKDGARESDDWWIGMERDVDVERRELWRKQA